MDDGSKGVAGSLFSAAEGPRVPTVELTDRFSQWLVKALR